jgi:hypothetical protein
LVGIAAIVWSGVRSATVQDTIKSGIDKLLANPPTAQGIAKELKGGNSVCYWYANLNAPRDPEGGFSRTIVSTDLTISDVRRWVYQPGVAEYSPEYMDKNPYVYLSGRASPCFATGYAIFRPTIKPGKYKIDFTAENGAWRETPTITENDKEIIEEWIITKDDVGEITKGSQRKAK